MKKDLSDITYVASLLKDLTQIDEIISISTNVIPSDMYPTIVNVHMTAKGFFQTFGDKEFAYRRGNDDFIIASYCEGDINYHALTKGYFLNERGEIR